MKLVPLNLRIRPPTFVFKRTSPRRAAVAMAFWLAGGAVVASCSSEEAGRTIEKNVEDGLLHPAPRVFGQDDGSEAQVAETLSPRAELESFDPFVDPPRDASVYCGDGAYDPAIEECDDGYGTESDVCSNDCQTRDILAVPAANGGNAISRALGTGPHPLSGSQRGGALVFADLTAQPRLILQRRDFYGNRRGEVLLADAAAVGPSGTQPTTTSQPVVATLPDGSHVVAYNDLNGDEDELGVALVHVAESGPEFVGYPYDEGIGAQYDPDLIWTGQRLVIAWSDTADDRTGPDVRVREFGADLVPYGAVKTLANSALPEAHVTLSAAPGDDGWAAAWRRGEVAGNESIVVSWEGETVEFRPTWDGQEASAEVGPVPEGDPLVPDLHLMPGHMDDRLGVAPVGEAQLAVAFTVGTDPLQTGVANVFRLWMAVVDFEQADVVWIGPVEALGEGGQDATVSQRSPALADGSSPLAAAVLGRVYLAWRSDGVWGDRAGEDLWLKRLDWDPESEDLSTAHEEVRLVREEAHAVGDQRQPALATILVPGGHALAMAWEDWGRNFDDGERRQALPDIAVQVAPVPLRRDDDKLKDCDSQPCGVGEGPCFTDEQCAGSLICAARRGPWHGYGPATGVCEPATCSDEIQSAGEAGTDCGGECGPCFPCAGASSSSGTAHFCSAVCPCDDIEGDCDSNYDCVPGLDCFEDQGRLAGYPEGIDLCMAVHCQNETHDSGETGVDCGGTDCVSCAPGLPEYCSTANVCNQVGEGGCKSDAGCGVDDGVALVCAAGQGELYGLPNGQGACVPLTCAAGRGGNFSTTACSAACPCGSGAGHCVSDEDCLSGTVCDENRGLYFGQGAGVNVCVSVECTNGVKDAGEVVADCGGACGSECSVCSGNPTITSFEYPADSEALSSEARGWNEVPPVLEPGLSWHKSTNASDGSESLAFAGCGEATLRSPQFLTHDFPLVGEVLHLDLAFAESSPPTDSHIQFALSLRDMLRQTSVEVLDVSYPVAGATGQYLTQAIVLPQKAREWLADDRGGLQWELHLDYCGAAGQDFLWFDNLRFGGRSVARRSTCEATSLPEQVPGDAVAVLGFDDVSLWDSSDTTILAETTDVRQGSGAARLEAADHTISSAVPVGVLEGHRLTLDVRLPDSTTALSGSITVEGAPCTGITGPTSFGTTTLHGLPAGEWVTIPIGTSPVGMDAFCELAIQTVLSGADSGSSILFDNMRFEPASHCNDHPQIDEAPFAWGMSPAPDGSPDNPYRLCTAAQVQSVMDDSGLWDENFVLEADIDLSNVAGQIGTNSVNFLGTFDGNRHYLSNYSLSSGPRAGFFGVIRGDGVIDGITDGVVNDLTLADPQISGSRFVGGLVGIAAQDSLIQDVYVANGSVFATGSQLGGLAGRNEGTIERSYSSAEIVSDASNGFEPGKYLGGLVGVSVGPIVGSRALGDVTTPTGSAIGGLVGDLSSQGTIEDSSAHGTVSVDGDSVGGLVGRVRNSVSIKDSSAHGDVLLGPGSHSAGGLLGAVEAGASVSIEQSHALGDVLGGDHSLGGLVGRALTATISECSASGDVEGEGQEIGGLLGYAADTTVSRSFARGTVVASGASGGLIGGATSTSITDSYAWGNVANDTGTTAGLVGSVAGVSVVRSYALGSLAHSDASTSGALIGFDVNADGTYSANFYQESQNPGLWPIGGGVLAVGEARSAAEFLDPGTFTAAGWDFLNVWESGDRAPELRRSLCTLYDPITAAPFLTGISTERVPDGSATRPYPLCNAAQVQWLMDHQAESFGSTPLLASHYALEADIDLTGVTGMLGDNTWSFSGSLDGRGRSLMNYVRTAPGEDVQGLFADLSGEVRNVLVRGFQVTCGSSCGTLAGRSTGYVRSVIVENSFLQGTDAVGAVGQIHGQIEGLIVRDSLIEASGTMVGGAAGQLIDGSIEDSRVVGGSVVASGGVGGLVGVGRGTVSRCETETLVTALSGDNTGGLMGHANVGQLISDSRALGPVIGVRFTGGLVGLLTTGVIEDSSASGTVSGTAFVGGAVGGAQEGAFVTRCHASGNVESPLNGAYAGTGGFVGLTHDALNGTQTTVISYCTASGKVTGRNALGGFLGKGVPLGTDGRGGRLENCVASGDVIGGNGSDIGGFAGAGRRTRFEGCTARGDVVAPNGDDVGGFLGGGRFSEIIDCEAVGDVTARLDAFWGAGGIVAWFADSSIVGSVARGTVTSGARAGGLASYLQSTHVFDSSAYGDVTTAVDTFAGGLVAEAHNSTIEMSRAYGTVTNLAPNTVDMDIASGGLVGYALSSSISKSEAHGTVSGNGQLGGLIGSGSDATIWDSYATGRVHGAEGGGLIGKHGGTRVKHSYTTSALVEGGGTIAGLLDPESDAGIFDSVFGNSTSNPGLLALNGVQLPGASNLTSTQMLSESSFVGWDFVNTWQMGPEGPVLRSGYCNLTEQDDAPPFVAGIDEVPTGGAEDPFVLCTASQVQTVMATSALWDRNFRLAQSIDLSTVVGQIGTEAEPFVGTFDGAGFELFNYTLDSVAPSVGLFGRVVGDGAIDGSGDGHIRALRLVSATVSGAGSTGALVGSANHALLEVVGASGTVSTSDGASSNTGGLVGLATNGTVVRDARADVTVAGFSRVGGLVGSLEGDSGVEDCVVSSDVSAVDTGSSDVGGVVGWMSASSVEDCSAAGDVAANGSHVGGLVGGMEAYSYIAGATATGAVLQTSGTAAGGLVGLAFSYPDEAAPPSGAILDSSASGTVTATSGDKIGGLVGEALFATVLDSHATGVVVGGSTVGGLVGEASQDSTFARCWASGSITATGPPAGGLIANMVGGTVTDCFATGTVSGTSNVGGLVGTAQSGTLQRSYAGGTVSGTGTRGAIVGTATSLTLSGTFGNSEVNGGLQPVGNDATAGGVSLLNADQLSVAAPFEDAGWDFSSVWRAGSSGPTLQTGNTSARDNPCVGRPLSDSPPFVHGLETPPDGSPENPYPLCNVGQMLWFWNLPDLTAASFRLYADIDISGLSGRQLGTDSPYSGTFDGNGHTLSGYESGVGGGLFGTVTGTIQKLRLVGFHVQNNGPVGLLVDVAQGATIDQIQIADSLLEGAGATGALAGSADSSSLIRDCVVDSRTSVSGLYGEVGGVVGHGSGTIQRVHSAATVESDFLAGGIVARAQGALIVDSLASGSVHAVVAHAGGLAGVADASDFARSVVRASVTGGDFVGAAVGEELTPSSYFGVVVSTSATGDIPLVGNKPGFWVNAGVSDTELTTSSTYAALEFDVTRVWQVDSSGPSLRGGASFYCEKTPQTNTSAFETASGTPSDPYRLCTAGQLLHVQQDPTLWSSNFLLEADLTADLAAPIGNNTTPFSGNFDGNGYVLRGLSLSGSDDVGLFGVVDGDAGYDGNGDGVVRHLHVARFAVAGENNVGGLVGRLVQGRVEDVQSQAGSAEGTRAGLGGLIGFNAGSVARVDVDAQVSHETAADQPEAYRDVGGVVGVNQAWVSNAVGRGAVTVVSSGPVAAGGVIGRTTGGQVQHCAGHGAVTVQGSLGGGLIGRSEQTVIADSEARGSVTVEGEAAGGLVGLLEGGSCVGSSAHGDVRSDLYSGGLVALLYDAPVGESHAYGSVWTNNSVAGGLVGYVSNATIAKSSGHGAAMARAYAGGLVGYAINDTGSSLAIEDVLSTSTVMATAHYGGGLFGYIQNFNIRRAISRAIVGESYAAASADFAGYLANSHLTDCTFISTVGITAYADEATTGTLSSTSLTELATPSKYSGFDLSGTWVMRTGGPVLTNGPSEPGWCESFTQSSVAPFVTDAPEAPDGSMERPYVLCNVDQFAAVMSNTALWSKSFRLGAHVAFPAAGGQIGTAAVPFTGTFDGQGYALFDYSISGVNDVGLFGVTSGGSIRNLTLVDPDVAGATNVGAVVGRLEGGGDVSGVRVVGGGVDGQGQHIGGVVGYAAGGSLSQVVSSCTVDTDSTEDAGGIVGHLASGYEIAECLSTSSITEIGSGGEEIGGLVGDLRGTARDCHYAGDLLVSSKESGGLAGQVSGGQVLDSTSTGTVTTTADVLSTGGLVGLASAALILRSASAVTVDGYGQVGGLAGYIYNDTAVEHCFAMGDVTASFNSAGGLVGYTPSATSPDWTVSKSYATGNVHSEDYAGGLMGYTRHGVIEDSYAWGDATVDEDSVGGLVGEARDLTIARSYSMGDVTATIGGKAGSFIGNRDPGYPSTVTYSLGNKSNNSDVPQVGNGVLDGVGYYWGSYITGASTPVPTEYNNWDFVNVWEMTSEGPVLR